MKEYSEEQFNQLPEFAREDYVKDGETYKHAGVLKMKDTLNGLNSKLESQKSEYSQLNDRLTEFEQNKVNEIEQARAEALEQAKTKGEVADIEKLYQEQIEDAARRAKEEGRSEAMKEIASEKLQSKADAELSDIIASLKPKDEFSSQLMKDHLLNRRKIEDGKIIYLNADGSASSLDKSGLINDLQQSGVFKPLTSYTPPTMGGGNMNGNDGSGAPSVAPKTLEECKGDRKLEAEFFNNQLNGN